jgi:hypothetical protein
MCAPLLDVKAPEDLDLSDIVVLPLQEVDLQHFQRRASCIRPVHEYLLQQLPMNQHQKHIVSEQAQRRTARGA